MRYWDVVATKSKSPCIMHCGVDHSLNKFMSASDSWQFMVAKFHKFFRTFNDHLFIIKLNFALIILPKTHFVLRIEATLYISLLLFCLQFSNVPTVNRKRTRQSKCYTVICQRLRFACKESEKRSYMIYYNIRKSLF